MRWMTRGWAPAAALCMLAAGCGASETAEPASSATSGGEAAVPSSGSSAFDAALEAAVVYPAADQPESVEVLSSTRSGGCTIPCGESGVGGQGPIIVLSPTDDPTYGTTQQNPIRVGGVSGYHEERYLRSLWGPDGQPIRFERLGSCCPMEDGGLLDAILVHYEGLDEPIRLYLDAYHPGPLLVPVGFTGAPPRGPR